MSNEQLHRLMAVLRPFAEQADIIDCQKPYPAWWSFRFGGSIAAITLGDCRRAKEELTRLEEELRDNQ